MSGTRQKDAGGSGLFSFHAFGMIMGDTGMFPLAARSVSSKDGKAHPTGLIRMAEPFPKLL